jgi:hypothetical protein
MHNYFHNLFLTNAAYISAFDPVFISTADSCRAKPADSGHSVTMALNRLLDGHAVLYTLYTGNVVDKFANQLDFG